MTHWTPLCCITKVQSMNDNINGLPNNNNAKHFTLDDPPLGNAVDENIDNVTMVDDISIHKKNETIVTADESEKNVRTSKTVKIDMSSEMTKENTVQKNIMLTNPRKKEISNNEKHVEFIVPVPDDLQNDIASDLPSQVYPPADKGQVLTDDSTTPDVSNTSTPTAETITGLKSHITPSLILYNFSG